jgi:hypothetical protein
VASTFSLDSQLTDGGKVVSLTRRSPFTPQVVMIDYNMDVTVAHLFVPRQFSVRHRRQ